MDAPSMDFTRAGSLEELKAKGRLVLHGPDRPILVVYDRGRVFALDNRCPHMGFPLDRGSVEDGILTSHGVFPVKLIRSRRPLACHPRSGAKRSGAGSEATLTRRRPDTLSRASAPLRACGCLCGLCCAHSFWHCASPFEFGFGA